MKAIKEADSKSNTGNSFGSTNTTMDSASITSSEGDPVCEEMIAVAAYFRSEKRDFAAGNEMLDWLQAEAEFKAGGTPQE